MTIVPDGNGEGDSRAIPAADGLEPLFVTALEAARLLGIGRTTLYELIVRRSCPRS